MTLNMRNSKLLDFIYQHTQADEWSDGIELHQSQRVLGTEKHGDLLLSKISCFSGKNYEVRIKVHPKGSMIQWLECTCYKNRKNNLFCEHIIASAIYLNEAYCELFSRINFISTSHLPAKRQTTKNLLHSSTQTKTQETTTKNLSASQSILDHLKSSITSISFSKGIFKIKIAVTPKTTSLLEMSIDHFGNFIEHQENSSPLLSKTKYQIQKNTAVPGFLIEEKKEEEIKIKKIISCSDSTFGNTTSILEIFRENTTHKNISYIVSSKDQNIGKNYLYLENQGFFKIEPSNLNSFWLDTPSIQTLKNDQIALFFDKDFENYFSSCPVWMSQELYNKAKVSIPDFENIELLSSKDGWFYLDPKYRIENHEVPMVDLIKKSKNEKRKYFYTPKGWIKIPEFISENNWTLSQNQEQLATNKLGLLRLKAMSGKLDPFVGSIESIKMIKDELELKEEYNDIDISHSKLNLRPYQKEGLKWLWWLYSNKLHGLLADDMGLGKTHQTMALLSAIQSTEKQKNHKFLVVCPTTVLEHWYDKISNFAPKLNPLKYHGINRNLAATDNSETTTILTTYGIMLRDIKRFSSFQWDAVILDEAHYVKNNKTTTYKAACLLDSRIRICLTGTPMENHLSELKNIFDFLVPGYLGSTKFFNKTFIDPILQHNDIEKEHTLHKLLYPLKLRRMKSEVIKELPNKIEDIRYCALSSEQVKCYQDVLKQHAVPLIEKLKSERSVPYLHVFTTLQLLKQITNHPALFFKSSNYENYKSGKFDLFKDILEESLNSNQKVVIFSQYLQMIKIIEQHCKSQNILSVSMTGQSKNRGAIIKQFQEKPEVKVFIGSLLAGGMGIDLTAASVVIHYDRWWNPSKENQATDRVHRIGQNNSVQVFKLVTKGTLEEKIDSLINEKSKNFNRFVEKDQEIFKTLSRQDMIELLDSSI